MLKQEKGITLIALVITIIVLLILAGVTIAMLSGDNGILPRSTEARAKNAISSAQEEVSLEYQAIYTEVLNDKYTTTAGTSTDIYDTVVSKVTTLSLDESQKHGCTVTLGSTITITYDNYTLTGSISEVTDGASLSWNSITKNES